MSLQSIFNIECDETTINESLFEHILSLSNPLEYLTKSVLNSKNSQNSEAKTLAQAVCYEQFRTYIISEGGLTPEATPIEDACLKLMFPRTLDDTTFTFLELTLHCLKNEDSKETFVPILVKVFINLVNKANNDDRLNYFYRCLFPENATREDPLRNHYLTVLNECLSERNLAISTVPVLGKLFGYINKRVIESDYGMNSLDACIQNINHLVNGEHRENITETVINYLQGTIEHRVRSKSPNSRITQPSQMIHGVYKQNTANFGEALLMKSPLVELQNFGVLRVPRDPSLSPEEQNQRVLAGISEELFRTNSNFKNPRYKGEVEREKQVVSDYYNNSFFPGVYSFVSKLIMTKKTRSKALKWIGFELDYFSIASKMGTHSRGAFVDFISVTDAIFFNLSNVLVRMSLPFCNEKMLSKIDDRYFTAEQLESSTSKEKLGCFTSPFIENEDSIILASEEESVEQKALIESLADDGEFSFNFITQCFNLTHRTMKLALTGLIQKRKESDRYSNHLSSAMQNGQGGPSLIQAVTVCYMNILSIDSLLLSREIASPFIIFGTATMNYLANKPLSERPSQPMFYVENVVDYLSICRRGNTELLELEEEIDFFDRNSGRKIASFKGQPVSRDLLKGACDIMVNPKYHLHTRCDVADALTVMLPGHEVDDSEYDDYNEYAGGSTAANVRTGAFHLFSENPVELMKLVRGVLQVYSDCERAGDYEVASKRRPLYRFFKYFNKNKACSEILSKIAKEANAWNNDDAELPIFLLFQTKLFQDANEFLTDGLQHLKDVNEKQKESDEHALNSLEMEDAEERSTRSEELQSQLSRLIQSCNWELSNARLCLDLIQKLSAQPEIAKVFLSTSTYRAQHAQMMNLFISSLSSKKERRLLKMDNDKIKFFKPKIMICQLCQIMVNFIINNPEEEQSELFVNEVIHDVRSFKIETYEEARALFKRFYDIPEVQNEINQELEVAKFDLVMTKIGISCQEDEENEIDYDDGDEELYCPLTCELLENAVMLPGSKQIVNRDSIVRQLMTNPLDPFNRSPLTADKLIPMPEIVEKVRIYKEDKKSEFQKKKDNKKSEEMETMSQTE